jgi:hypothetical protein
MENCIETVPERTPEYRHQLATASTVWLITAGSRAT